MTRAFDTAHNFNSLDRGRLSLKIFSLTVPGAVALALSVSVGVWMEYLRPDSRPTAAPGLVIDVDVVEAPAVAPPVKVVENPYGALFDPRSSSGAPPVSFARSFPLVAEVEPTPPTVVAVVEEPENTSPTPPPAEPEVAESSPDSLPMPMPRPAELGAPPSRTPPHAVGLRSAQQNRKADAPTTGADNRSFFEKLFGGQQSAQPALAYAAPDGGLPGNTRNLTSSAAPGRYDRQTAVYDVSAHTVYLPNGTRLEAHSGLGDRLDDPRHVDEKMRGATPPSVYELEPRGQRFHGVAALRLKPVGGATVYGRTGLLAHTYMLGPRGDSNGCVSFKNYNAFLQAYQNGEIKHLAVVARLN
jgi:hypothetical protein